MKVLFSQKEIEQAVIRVAKEINNDFNGEDLVLIGVLKGSFIFLADLVRELYRLENKKVQVDFISISSYSNRKHSGQTHLLSDVNISLEKKNVVIIEDIADTGLTLEFIRDFFMAKNPKKLKFAVLVDKKAKREVEFEPDYVGLNVDGTPWLEGYGLDTDELNRGRPEIIKK